MVENVPYSLHNLADGRVKAFFLVPENTATFLTANPILCRGAAFILSLCDQEDLYTEERPEGACVLFCEFYSPEPETVAVEISQRLANRIANAQSNEGISVESFLSAA